MSELMEEHVAWGLSDSDTLAHVYVSHPFIQSQKTRICREGWAYDIRDARPSDQACSDCFDQLIFLTGSGAFLAKAGDPPPGDYEVSPMHVEAHRNEYTATERSSRFRRPNVDAFWRLAKDVFLVRVREHYFLEIADGYTDEGQQLYSMIEIGRQPEAMDLYMKVVRASHAKQ